MMETPPPDGIEGGGVFASKILLFSNLYVKKTTFAQVLAIWKDFVIMVLDVN